MPQNAPGRSWREIIVGAVILAAAVLGSARSSSGPVRRVVVLATTTIVGNSKLVYALLGSRDQAIGTGLNRSPSALIQNFMPFVIGIVLSLGVAFLARSVGFDRDRAFYSTVLIVMASYYVLFAAMSGSVQTVALESLAMTVFVVSAIVGFKSNTWIVVGGLVGHGVFDAFHGNVLDNAGAGFDGRPSVWRTTSELRAVSPGSCNAGAYP